VSAEPRYILLTSADDGSEIRIRNDHTILALHTVPTGRHLTGEPGGRVTVVTASFGAYRVTETPRQIVRLMAGKSNTQSVTVDTKRR
jgi:hypothetical protein